MIMMMCKTSGIIGKAMRSKKTKATRLLVALLCCGAILFSFTGCQALRQQNGGSSEPEISDQSGSGAAQEESERFDAYIVAFMTHGLTADGLTLHWFLNDPASLGITEYPNTLGDYTLEGLEQEQEWYRQMAQELEGFSYDALTPEQQDFYELLQIDFALQEEYSGMELYSEPNGVLDGVQTQLPMLLANYRFHTEQDIERYLVLLADLPRVYQECLVYQQKKAEAGLFMSELQLNEVLRTGQELIAEPDESFMLQSFTERLDAIETLTEEQRQAYEQQNYELWVEQVVPATQTLLDGLEALRSFCSASLGMAHQKDGKKYYELLAKSSTGSDWTVQEMAAKVDQALYRTLEEMGEIMGANQAATLEAIEFQESPPDLGTPEEMLSKLQALFQEDFPAIGEVAVQIKEVPESLRESSSPASYLRPPLDSPTENIIYINDAQNQDSLTLFTTLSHEGYPGHLYQNNYFLQHNTISMRSLLSYEGYSEGWATYAEMKSFYKLGLSDTAAELLALNQLFSLLITCRVDLGIHYDGWDRAQLGEFLTGYGFESAETLDAVYLQMLDDPAGSLPYVIGYLEFVEIEQQAQQELGDRFNALDYYQVILDCGPAPFSLVEQKVAAYIEEAATELPAA